ncbi:hypothetical protein CBR_g31201 [Chara braunii]|uniref:Uncharacterized protein n=1 Tax=Chara braunii TaxID=69332 RepID=A0A388JXL7_CHABU|nr:hypothetical protein CBR_g31201 [Chara braunii]|eukprot:GBG62564.1 hypothetical protein CBR_g31201 [Chara braunii]
MSRIINSKIEELDKQHQARTEEESRKIWKEIEKVVDGSNNRREGKEPVEEPSENRKRTQDKIEGSPPMVPANGKVKIRDSNKAGGATACHNAQFNTLDVGLLAMEMDNVKRTQDFQNGLLRGNRFSSRLADLFAFVAGKHTRARSASPSHRDMVNEPLGFDRVIPGKKAAVASAGKEGRAKYVEDLKKELISKTKYQWESLCKADKIKYYNKKQVFADLAEIRARVAYDEESEEEGLDDIVDDAQEENPS